MLTRALGRGGSSSRIIRRISSRPEPPRVSLSNGVVPVKQLVEQHAQRIDVAAGVDAELVHLRLLGAHVQRRADELREAGVERLLGERCADRLGDAEVDHLGDRLAVVQRDQDVGGLQVAVDDPLLVGVLHGLADGDEQLQPLADA